MIENTFTSGWTIKRPTVNNNGGIATTTYSTAATVKGRMRALSGSEIKENEKLAYRTSHRFYTEVADIRPADLILKSGLYYEVVFINNVMEMGLFLQIDCAYKEDQQGI